MNKSLCIHFMCVFSMKSLREFFPSVQIRVKMMLACSHCCERYIIPLFIIEGLI